MADPAVMRTNAKKKVYIKFRSIVQKFLDECLKNSGPTTCNKAAKRHKFPNSLKALIPVLWHFGVEDRYCTMFFKRNIPFNYINSSLALLCCKKMPANYQN